MAFADAPLKFDASGRIIIDRPINWNRMEDAVDLDVWNKLTAQFWLPERIALSNDLNSWHSLTDEEKHATNQVFTGLAGLDSLQGEVGAPALMRDARTQHEVSVLANIAFMEAFTEDTTLLTPRGYVPIAQIQDGDEVVQYHPESMAFSVAAAKTVPSHFAYEVYRIACACGIVSQHVSGGHRVFIRWSRKGEGKYHPETIEAHEIAEGVLSGYDVAFDVMDDEGSAVTHICPEGPKVDVQAIPAAQVYCVQVPSTYLVTGNESSTGVISGNCVHAKSYSSTSATFLTSEEIERYWRWFSENERTQYKVGRITDFYYGNDPLMRKAASTILESFLFYSGFYLPLHWSSIGKLTNTADLIRLIIRDEAIHGYYIGYKFQQHYAELPADEQERVKESVYDLLFDLYTNESRYTEEVYDPLGLTEDVKKFLHYNANKALMNLGFEGLFPAEETNVSPAIMAALTLTSETHDFFSGAGSSYTMVAAEETSDDDWGF